MKPLSVLLTIAIAIAGISSNAPALESQPLAGSDSTSNAKVDDQERPKRGKADRKRRKNADGEIAEGQNRGKKRGKGPRGEGPQANGPRGEGFAMDPAKLAERLMARFDSDGDQLLNANELTELLTEMQQRRRRGGPGGDGEMRRGGKKPEGQGPNRAGGKKGKNKNGKGRRQQEPVGDVGGDAPIRPGSDT